MSNQDYNKRIQIALQKAGSLVSDLENSSMYVKHKGDGPVTEMDHKLNQLLYDELFDQEEGWLSEESTDDLSRLSRENVWIIDPIDGTHQFIKGVPEWAISVAISQNGNIIEGGMLNPWANQLFKLNENGAVELNGDPVSVTDKKNLSDVVVLTSRGEIRWGNWDRYQNSEFKISTVGSIAYRLGLVASGIADATVSLEPKNEWDIAAGACLVENSGGVISDLKGNKITFNNKNTLIGGLIAAGPRTHAKLLDIINSTPSNIWLPNH
jgi:myo-inositol-1(or 4)-monophosphatase|tara:strand:+ start:1243 stop:2043 length:801 start_codon:yes stop_codon:yes gene_type:complete